MDEKKTASFNAALFLDRLATAAPFVFYAWGGCLLAAKVFPLPAAVTVTRIAVGSALLLAVAMLVELLRMGGRWFSPDYAAAWLDLRNHAGGRIIAGDPAALASVRVRPGATVRHLARRLALPALFVIGVALVPAPEHRERVSGAGMRHALARIEKKIEQAGDREALAKPDADELRKQLRQLRELAEKHPEAAAEALAALPERVDAAMALRLDRISEAMEKALAAWREMEKAAAGGMADAPDLDHRLAEMFDAIDELEKGEGGRDNLPRELREALSETGGGGQPDQPGKIPGAPGGSEDDQTGGMSRERLERILQALGEGGRELSGAASAVGAASPTGMFSAGFPESALDRAQSLSQTLGELTMTSAGGMEWGSGGIDKGPGDAPLVFGDESRTAGLRFEHHALPAAGALDPGMLLGRERTAIPEDAVPEDPRRVIRSGVAGPERVFSGERAATLGPARARAAERYFQSLGRGEKP